MCVRVSRGFLHVVGCWVTDGEFGPRCVEKPCWTFTPSLWRGRLQQAASTIQPRTGEEEEEETLRSIRSAPSDVCSGLVERRMSQGVFIPSVFAAAARLNSGAPSTRFISPIKERRSCQEVFRFQLLLHVLSTGINTREEELPGNLPRWAAKNPPQRRRLRIYKSFKLERDLTPLLTSCSRRFTVRVSMSKTQKKKIQRDDLFPLCFRPKKANCRCDHTLKASKNKLTKMEHGSQNDF